jgi:hypothetical protein
MDEQLQEALNQVAVEQLRADQAEQATATEKARADSAAGERDSLKAQVDALKKERTDAASVDVAKLQNQNKALHTQNAALKTRLDAAESPESIRAKVKERVALETKAIVVLGDKVRLDELDDRALMATVVEKLQGMSLDGKSLDYVRARFDSAIESHAAGAAAIERVRDLIDVKTTKNNERADSRSARQKFLEEQNNAWQKPSA